MKSNTKFPPPQSATGSTIARSSSESSASTAPAFRAVPIPQTGVVRGMPPSGGRPSPPALPPPAFFAAAATAGPNNFRRGPPFDPAFRPYAPTGAPPPFGGRAPVPTGDRRPGSTSGAMSAPPPPHAYAPHHRGPPHPQFDARHPPGPPFPPPDGPRFYPPPGHPRAQPPFPPPGPAASAPGREQVLRAVPSSGSTESGNSSQSSVPKQLPNTGNGKVNNKPTGPVPPSVPSRNQAIPQPNKPLGPGASGPPFRQSYAPPHGVGGPHPPPHYPPPPNYGRWGAPPPPPPPLPHDKSRAAATYGEYVKGKGGAGPSSGPYTTALQERGGGGGGLKRKDSGVPGNKMHKHLHLNGIVGDRHPMDPAGYGMVNAAHSESRDGATSPSQIDLNRRDDVSNMGCTCKKSKCLKLYCQCFAASMLCGDNCRCTMCNNTSRYEAVRKEAIRQILQRNPSAFDTKFKKTNDDLPSGSGTTTNVPNSSVTVAPATVAHKLGCKCRKSFCTKKYCECYNAGVKCGQHCRCIGCKNMPLGGMGGGGGSSSMAPPSRPPPMGMRHEYNSMVARMENPGTWMDAAHNLAFMKHSTPPRAMHHHPGHHPPPPPHHRHAPPPPPPRIPARRDNQSVPAPLPIASTQPPALASSSETSASSPSDDASRTSSLTKNEKTSNDESSPGEGGVNSLLLAAVAMTELCNGTIAKQSTKANDEQRSVPRPTSSSSDQVNSSIQRSSPSKRKSLEKTLSSEIKSPSNTDNNTTALNPLLSLATAATSTNNNASSVSLASTSSSSSSGQPMLTPRDRVKRTRLGTTERSTFFSDQNEKMKTFDMTPRVSSGTSKGDSSEDENPEENGSGAGRSVSDENSTPEKPVTAVVGAVGVLHPSYNYGTPTQPKKTNGNAEGVMTPVSARCIDFQHMGVTDRSGTKSRRRSSHHGEEDEEKKEDNDPMDMVVTSTASTPVSTAAAVPMMTTTQQ